MKAVILAAGRGARMGELTQDTPKPMLRVQGKPILEHILSGLVHAGFTSCCLVIGWKGEVIREYFGDGTSLGLRLEYVEQEVADGTGRAPQLARSFVGTDPFLLSYGDILVRPDTYLQMVHRWNEDQASGLVTVTEGQDVTHGGLLLFDDELCLRRVVEKPSLKELEELRETGWLKEGAPVYYNAGIYLFQPVLFEFTSRLQKSPRGEYELTDAISAMLTAGHRVVGLTIEGRWVDVRDPEVLAALQARSPEVC